VEQRTEDELELIVTGTELGQLAAVPELFAVAVVRAELNEGVARQADVRHDLLVLRIVHAATVT